MTRRKTGNTAITEGEPVKAGDIAAAKIKSLKVTKKTKQVLNCPKCNRAFKIQTSLDAHLSRCPGKIDGRPKGSENQKTKDMKAMKEAMQLTIAGRTNELLAAQFSQALGGSRLMRRYKTQKGRLKRGNADQGNEEMVWKVEQVYDDADFYIYLSLDHDENGKATDPSTGVEYFYLRGARDGGNTTALMNLFDRAYGKPKESVELGEDPDAPLPVHGTGTTTMLRKRFVDMIKSEIKAAAKEVKK